jgi:membrane-bound ClpP family serine protease
MVEVKKTLQESANAVAQPFIDAAKAIGDFAKGLHDAGMESTRLEQIEQRLLDLRIKQTVAQAQRNKEIAERLIAEDELLSYEEREAALQRALDLEGQNLKEQVKQRTNRG